MLSLAVIFRGRALPRRCSTLHSFRNLVKLYWIVGIGIFFAEQFQQYNDDRDYKCKITDRFVDRWLCFTFSVIFIKLIKISEKTLPFIIFIVPNPNARHGSGIFFFECVREIILESLYMKRQFLFALYCISECFEFFNYCSIRLVLTKFDYFGYESYVIPKYSSLPSTKQTYPFIIGFT